MEKMSSPTDNQQVLSPSMKGEHLSIEAERDIYRQRYSNMTLILKELQQQVAQYKVRCAGVDTFAVLLKEANQANVTLSQDKKKLVTAVANLQNRLSTNGLSPSVNMEETDMYIPGTSTQTLDNLARENARLRSLLKSTEHHGDKKQSEDVQELKTLVEDLESSKNQLQAKLHEVEHIKFIMVQQYEETIASLKENIASECSKKQNEIDKCLKEIDMLKKNADKDWFTKDDVSREKVSVESQTTRMDPDVVSNMRKHLKELTLHCTKLDENLDYLCDVSVTVDVDKAGVLEQNNEKVSGMTNEAYQELTKKYHEVNVMNQRWQTHNDIIEKQHRSNIAELKSEIDNWKQQANLLSTENKRLTQIVEELQVQLNQLRHRQTTPFDHSMVEILKQQIQVCTEDFNNERKDHEVAVKKNKLFQEELRALRLEFDQLKQERDNLKFRLESLAAARPEVNQVQGHNMRFEVEQPPQMSSNHPIIQPSDFPPIPHFPPVRTLDISTARRTETPTFQRRMPQPNPNYAPTSHLQWRSPQGSNIKFESEVVPTHLLSSASSAAVTTNNTAQGYARSPSKFAFEGDSGASSKYMLDTNRTPVNIAGNSDGALTEKGAPPRSASYPQTNSYELQGSSLQHPHQFISYQEFSGTSDTDLQHSSMSRPDPRASLPDMKRKSSTESEILKNRGVMSCFKCGKQYPEQQLLQHINECKD